MPTLGRADLLVVPRFDGLSATVNRELAGIDTAGSGRRAGSGFMSGLASGASIGIWSQVASRAIGAVTSSLGAAAGRVDTLNNYPRIMESLGVEAGAANASIQVMSDALSNVPTRLDDMASTVQGLYAATSKYGLGLDTVTDAGLALNGMLLAGGQSTQIVTSAMEQFRQMVAKGKPDMQDWRSLISAAPGQLNQMAEAMLGAGATADDLYAALGGGREADYTGPFEWGSLGVDEFVSRMAGMKDEFASAAEEAQGGISTAYANMTNAVTKGVAGVLEAIGQDTIASAIGDVKGGIRAVFGDLEDITADLVPYLTGLWDSVVAAASAVAPQFHNIGQALGTVVGGALDVATVALGGFARAFDFANGQQDAKTLADSIQAISGPAEATASAVDVMGWTFESAMARVQESSDRARDAYGEYLDTLGRTSREVSEANGSYQAQVSELERAGAVIDAYMGQTDLTAAQQRELHDAVDTVNQACGTQYEVMENGYDVIDTETGKLQDNTTEIWNNIHAREQAARADTLGVAQQAAEDNYAAALNYLQEQKQATSDAGDAVEALVEKYGSLQGVIDAATSNDGTMAGVDKDAREAISQWESEARAMREADETQRLLAQSSAELAAEQDALYRASSGAELSLSDLALTSTVAMQAFNDGGSKASLSILDFSDTLAQCAENGDALKGAMDNPETMARIVAAYDGTAASLEGIFDELLIGFDEVAAADLDTKGTIGDMGDYIVGLSDRAYGAVAMMGLSADEFAAKLSGAGVSMEELSAVGTDAFENMLVNCGGDLDTLTWMLGNYNDIPLVTKEGDVVVGTSQLVDAQGRVVVWNGTTFVDKETRAEVKDGQLRDAMGRVYDWNHGTLKPLSTSVTVNTSSVDSAKAKLRELNGYDGKVFRTTVSTAYVRTNATVTPMERAEGGVRLRKHAAGDVMVANNPGPGVPLDIVGEAGAEAIVPLTDRYAKPFVDLVADGVANRMGGGRRTTNNIYVNGTGDPDAVADAIARRLALLDA